MVPLWYIKMMSNKSIGNTQEQASTFANIRQLVTHMLGTEPTGIERTGSPDALFLDVGNRRLVLKKAVPNRPGSALVEAWVYRECQRRGVRTPEVVAVSHDPPCIIVQSLPGDSLWSPSRRRAYDRDVWHKAGEDLRAIHEIRLDGFGPLIMTDDGPRGRDDRWCPFVRFAREEGIQHLARRGYISVDTAQHLERRYDDAASTLNHCANGRLLHGDLEGGHVFGTATGAYSGLIDFGQAQAGDPRWDLARVVLWDGQEALDALLDGYGRDAVNQDDRKVVFPLYLLAFIIYQAVRFDRDGRHDDARSHLQQVGYAAAS